MNNKNPYTPLKINYHQNELQEMRNGKQPNPILVQIVISDLCNHDCNFCSYRMTGYTSNQLFGVMDKKTGEVNNNPSRFLPYEKIKEILEDCKEIGVKAIELTGGGEPTVHPAHPEVFRKTLELGLDLALVTNGMILRQESMPSLMNAKWIRVSLDAGTPNTYGNIRKVKPDTFWRVIENIDKIVKKRNGQNEPTLGISFVVTKENYTEILTATNIAKKSGADYIRFGAMFSQEDEKYYDGILKEIHHSCREAESISTNQFQVFNQFNKRLGDLLQKNPDYKYCGHMQVNTYVGADMNVYRCCALAYNKRGLIGSIENQRFKDLWQSQEKQNDFDNFDARKCKRCPFNDKNREINNLIQMQTPMHINYV